jgi:hypothetical protein
VKYHHVNRGNVKKRHVTIGMYTHMSVTSLVTIGMYTHLPVTNAISKM